MTGSGAESAGVSHAHVKVIEWEDLQQELARLWSLSSALKKAKEGKEALARRLESVIQDRSEYLHQTNELEEMRQKLEAQKLAMGDLLLRSKRTAENVKSQKEQLCFDIRLLLVASKTLFAAHQQLQEANKLLAGERGHGHLQNLQKMVRARQQYMVAQVSALYPLKASGEQPSGVKSDVKGTETSYASPSNTSKPSHMSSFTILDLQLPALPLKKTSFFGDKKELQRSASALGYVAHAALLIAAYLDVPLRYPLRFGCSRSYLHDYAPSTDHTSSDLASGSISVMGMIPKPTEFPLFLEGQDSTRATYAIFLLNKDIEQLLNYIGAQSLGPKHVLPNLKELMRIILAGEYIDM